MRTVAVAAAVTLTDALLAFPIAYYMARVASPRTRRAMVVAVLMPLWAAYLVKVYAWRVILQENGFLEWILTPFGIDAPGLGQILNAWLVFSYLWLPYMVLPIYAGPRADSELAARGLGGPWWPELHDVPPRRPAARLPRARRGIDLHVLADPR